MHHHQSLCVLYLYQLTLNIDCQNMQSMDRMSMKQKLNHFITL